MSSKPVATKTSHALSSPYPEPSWPAISSQLETTIVDTLLNILTPVTQYREKCASVSKGKGRKRRKKDVASLQDQSQEHEPGEPHEGDAESTPALLQYMTIGFNSTITRLELLSQQARLDLVLPASNTTPVAVFVCKQVLPSVMTAPLPLLLTTASRTMDESIHPRLVPISQSNAERIAAALKQPRTNVIAIMNEAPGSEELARLVRTEIAPVQSPFVHASTDRTYLPVNIHSTLVTVNKAQNKKENRKRPNDDV